MSLTIIKPSKYVEQKLLTDVAGEVFSYIGINFEVGLKFACENCIQKLNKQYRGIDKPTNVLSFNEDDKSSNGEILICETVVAREAAELGRAQRELVLLYLVHGMLHLAGFDHQNIKDRDKMEKVEKTILKKFEINIER